MGEVLSDERQLGFKQKRGTIEAVYIAQQQIIEQTKRFNLKRLKNDTKLDYLDGSTCLMGPNKNQPKTT